VIWPVIDTYKWNKDSECRLCHKCNFAILYPEGGGNITSTKDGTHPQTTGCHKLEQKNRKLMFHDTFNITIYLKPEYNKFLKRHIKIIWRTLLNWPVIDPYKWNEVNNCKLCHKSNLAVLYSEHGGNIIPTKDGTHPQTIRYHKLEQPNTKRVMKS
jgi:hypothetical protein